jgi:CBS domain-containing protein
MSETISSLMERRVTCIDLDDSVSHIDAVFAEKALSWAPVVDGGNVAVGAISASDLLQFHAQARDPHAVHAWQLCTYKPLCVDTKAPLREVARAMVEQRIHHVVVTDAEGIAGVVSSLDFVRRFAATP